MTDREALSRLVFELYKKQRWSLGMISAITETTERHVRNLVDEGEARALLDLQRQQSIQLCGRKIRN